MSMVLPKIHSLKLEGKRHENLTVAELVETALLRKEAILTSNGALRSTTGEFTGRAPKNKYIVNDLSVQKSIDWGSVNQPMRPSQFKKIFNQVQSHLRKKEVFLFDGFAGNDPNHRLPIRVINEYAWQNLFAHQLFIRPTPQELKNHQPQFTVICTPDLKIDADNIGTHSGTVIAISFEYQMVLITGTHYAGEMKKSIFSVMNYLLPHRDVLPMHCSANIGKEDDVALFFGLSGTGKTTLSADPSRSLIGDDEHGWSNDGVFNFEGGCYAKCIGLSKETEPQIWEAVRFGTVLENVVLNENRTPDFNDGSLTENTRAAYPVEYIPNAVIPGIGSHPNIIFFLTADAFGVLPPISKLAPQQAMYHFLCGYTSKLAGTEQGITQPTAAFSACFGAPFLPLPAEVYAKMLGEKIFKHDAQVYLINTGWTGGPYGIGERVKLRYTRAMITAAIKGTLNDVDTTTDEIFGLTIPNECPGVPTDILVPQNTWTDQNEYRTQARNLAELFRDHFRLFDNVEEEIKKAGPKV